MLFKTLRHIWRTWPIFSPLRKVKYRLHLKRKEWQERLVRFFLYGQRPLSQLYSRRALQEYIDHLDDFVCADKALFVPDSDEPVSAEKAPRVIAYYLPQFYAFPQNDAWHGRGFTEWTTAGKGFPMFAGHYQPRIPYDVGFYSLKDTEVMHRQVELAQRYGVSGFCFYYYWFSGKRLMEKPLENFLKDKTLHFPFCLCWACDRWSKRWDGGTQELLMDSYLREGDARRFFADILPFVEDARYIRLAGRPLLQIYHVRQFPHDVYMRFLTELQELAEKEGFRFHISIALTNDMYAEVDYTSIQPSDWGADSFVEFPPHGRLRFDDMPRRRDVRFVNPCFHGKIYDMNEFFENRQYETPLVQGKCFRTVFPSWDNTARKWQTSAMVYTHITPERYGQWLESSLRYTQQNFDAEEQLVFVNAWNEWGEGAYLEPDIYYGYAYLTETRRAIERVCRKPEVLSCE